MGPGESYFRRNAGSVRQSVGITRMADTPQTQKKEPPPRSATRPEADHLPRGRKGPPRRIEGARGSGDQVLTKRSTINRLSWWWRSIRHDARFSVFDDGCPHLLRQRLGHHAPPVLFGSGNVALLGHPVVGIVDSQNVDKAGGEVAQAVAPQVVAMDLPVVSGDARGVDNLAVNAAFQNGGR